ncbi:YgfZ/GcvT domain-containing protein [Cognatiluteimonas profundi]|uniref:CAF17-like 4Fe-4S cluster assembly/insertion protein YgfZ n=1 Tax=Cognatiluteimonas profundi TaxID=2594501 RepID=UPI00131B2AB2|nr:folate-binding protein [Lysobacter profundi]
MSDNPQPVPDDFFALPDHRVLMLGGRDAIAFAQAQFMNDLATLAPGHWQWSGWLTPKGRLIALFALIVFDAESVQLVLPDADPAELATQLRRYVFRSRVDITVRDDLFVGGAFARQDAAGNAIQRLSPGEIALDVGGDASPRTLRIGSTQARSDPAAVALWKAVDLTHGLPRLPPSQSAQWTPQQLSLDRLRAYSVKKGCYPGQEIVARTHFLGQSKRGLALFDADTMIPDDADVSDGGQVLGKVVSIVPHGAGVRLLAVLPPSRGVTTLSADGSALREQPFSDGLAR